MITQRKMRLVICLVLGSTCIGALGTEPNEMAPVLRFDIGQPEKLSLRTLPIIPTYAAELELQWHFAEPNDPNVADLLKTSAGKSISELQRKLVETEKAINVHSSTRGRFGSKFGTINRGSRRCLVYAVSEADAKSTVRALVEYWAEKGAAKALRMKKTHVERLTEKQEQLLSKMVEQKKESERISSELPRAHRVYNEAVDNSQYSLHPSGSVPEEVRKTIFEMGKMLSVLNIEIIGIQSKLSAVRRHSAEKDVVDNQTLVLALKEMAILQEIELVGAESRRQAIMSVKRREEALYHQYETFHDLKSKSETLKTSISRNQGETAVITRELADRLYPGRWPFTVPKGVRIRPIQAK